MKQTAVEWLFNELLETPKDKFFWYSILEKAKQMEKEQIAKAWDDGDYSHFYSKETGKDFENGQEYYNETYGK